MSALLAALAALAVGAAAQTRGAAALEARSQAPAPAVPAVPAALPDDPGAVAQRLRQAVFAAKPRFVLPQPTYTYRPRGRQDFQPAPVGHRVVEEPPLAPGGAVADPTAALTQAVRVKQQSVQLSLLRAGDGVTAGVGVDQVQASLGRFHGPSERSAFLFLRLQLGRRDDGPRGLMLPRARVSERSGLGPEHSDDYSLDDLPGYRGRP